jgi:hypothetical protein
MPARAASCRHAPLPPPPCGSPVRSALRRRRITTTAAASLALAALPALAQPTDPVPDWPARGVFAQAGAGEQVASLTLGAIWPSPWQFRSQRLKVYWETTVGRWRVEDGGDGRSAGVTQLGLTPVIRWSPRPFGPDWYLEAGIGANLVTPHYRNRDRRFGTRFNFGDTLGIGRVFGADRRQELSLRLQHYSNAGLGQPNPGEEFLQLRYVWRY